MVYDAVTGLIIHFLKMVAVTTLDNGFHIAVVVMYTLAYTWF